MKRDSMALAAIAALIGMFFLRLFWPQQQIIVTPDFGRSDSWHFSIATKLLRTVPLWEPRMGMGFPLFAEGQAGALFLPNLLLFTAIRDPVTAYNATYVALFLTLGWGMYAWLRVIGCSRLASAFGAVTLLFSGQTIPRLPHHTLLETLSLFPVALTLAHLSSERRARALPSIALLSLTLSQQVFAGFPQALLLTLVTILLYAASRAIADRAWRRLLPAGVAAALGLGIGAAQILPSYEFLASSSVPQGFSPQEATYFSLPPAHLKTLVDAFSLGNPKMGTYPPFTDFDGSIFWENNLFIGWIPVVVLMLGFIRHPLGVPQGDALRPFFSTSLILSFLLMLGKHSPLYFLFSFWPMNVFRVPSRFAWIFLFTLISGASQMASRVPRVILAPLLLIHTAVLVTTWWDYHAIEPARMWLIPPPLLQTIKGSVRTIGMERVHNQQFLTKGWNGNVDFYRFLRAVPAPNSNLYWNIPQTDVYAGRFLKRSALVESLLGSEITTSADAATVSATGRKLLDLYHAQTVVSALPLAMEAPMDQIAATASATSTITAYGNPDAVPRAYLVSRTVFAPTLSKAAEALASERFIPGKTAIVHAGALVLNGEDAPAGTVLITADDPTRVAMRADVAAPQALLVFGDTYYPGWNAFVDGQKREIFPVNIKERGVILPQGSHEIVWRYQPKSVAVGSAISIVSLVATALLTIRWSLSYRDVSRALRRRS